jgi:chemotaxis regulatin CheY-phosphate phosphatase CheZ
VGLTRKIEQKLCDVGLDDLFEDNREEWITAARKAFRYLRDSHGEVATIRRDDVAEALEIVLNSTERLKDYLNDEKLSQNYWFRRFADFIIDRGWDEIQVLDEEGDEDGPGEDED